MGSRPEIRCVRLLSTAQQRLAAATASEASGMPKAESRGHKRTTPPATMAAKPRTMRGATFSRKTSQAMRAVKTASRLRRSETVEAGARSSPDIRRMGARTPPVATAHANQGRSPRLRRASVDRPRRSTRAMVRPIPEPRYKSAARSTGGESPASALANGVLAPNRAAAASAAMVALGNIGLVDKGGIPLVHRYRCVSP